MPIRAYIHVRARIKASRGVSHMSQQHLHPGHTTLANPLKPPQNIPWTYFFRKKNLKTKKNFEKNYFLWLCLLALVGLYGGRGKHCNLFPDGVLYMAKSDLLAMYQKEPERSIFASHEKGIKNSLKNGLFFSHEKRQHKTLYIYITCLIFYFYSLFFSI